MANVNDNLNKEMEQFVMMINFFGEHANDMTPVSTSSFIKELMIFSEKIKPIYVMELMRLNGGK